MNNKEIIKLSKISKKYIGGDKDVVVLKNVNLKINKGELISLRSRGVSSRPFEEVEELRRNAETKYRETEQKLQKELQSTEQKLRDLQRSASLEVNEGSPILSKEHAETLQIFRDQIINIRKKLRDVQRELRVDIEELGLLLKIYNVWLMPLFVSIASILVFGFRRRKRISHLAEIRKN